MKLFSYSTDGRVLRILKNLWGIREVCSVPSCWGKQTWGNYFTGCHRPLGQPWKKGMRLITNKMVYLSFDRCLCDKPIALGFYSWNLCQILEKWIIIQSVISKVIWIVRESEAQESAFMGTMMSQHSHHSGQLGKQLHYSMFSAQTGLLEWISLSVCWKRMFWNVTWYLYKLVQQWLPSNGNLKTLIVVWFMGVDDSAGRLYTWVI